MSAKTRTEAAPSRPEPKIRLSGVEWRLYLSSLLAGAYALAWIAFAAHTPRGTAEDAVAGGASPSSVRVPSVDASPRRGFVWISDLPLAERPAVSLPPGWAIAGQPGPGPAVVRRAAEARPRIRTRSS